MQEIIELLLVCRSTLKVWFPALLASCETTPPFLINLLKNMSGSKQRLKNVSSLLLRDDENDSLFALLGRGCLVRLYYRRRTVKSACGRLPGFGKLNEKKYIL